MALAAILRGVVGVLYGAQLWLTIDLSNPASIVSIFCALILSVLGVTFALYAVLGIVVAVRLGRGPALVEFLERMRFRSDGSWLGGLHPLGAGAGLHSRTRYP